MNKQPVLWNYVDKDVDAHDYDLVERVCANIQSRGEQTDFTAYNRHQLLTHLKKNQNCKTILEIGVENNPNRLTSTSIFLDNKDKDAFYFGVDIEDKSSLRDEENNVYTIQTLSENINEVMNILYSKGRKEIDFLFIDGKHSINQVIKEWEYTQWLSPEGIVGFHDTNHHPGPRYFIENVIDRNLWEVAEFTGEDLYADFGITFVWRKTIQ